MPAFWDIVASNALIATALAVVALLLGRVWKNAAAVHLLWVVVLLKLFTPPLVIAALPVAFASAIPSTAASPVRPELDPTGSRDAGPANSGTPRDPRIEAAPGKPSEAPGARSSLRAGIPLRPPSLSTILAALWGIGSGAMAMVSAIRIRRFAAAVRRFEPAPPAIRLLVAQLSGRLGLRRVPVVLMTDRPLPPLIWSLATPPRVILPARLFDGLGPPAQSTILAHELVHIRRHDHLVRLLELAATTVFWWHPVAWLASRQLRELEEECCDGRVLELLPDQPRTYATALVDTLEFLAGRACTPVPLRTTIGSTHSLHRRIPMLTQRRPNRLTPLSASLVASLVCLPLAGALATSPEAPGPVAPVAPEVQQPATVSPAVLRGRVTDKAGAPLPDARVRVSVPAADMRFADTGKSAPNLMSPPKLLETRTNAQGDYRLELPGITGRTTIALDALKPGYRRLVGTLMRGGDARQVAVEPGQPAEAALTLEPARYYRGTVVDEQGRPIPAVEIHAIISYDRGSAGVEVTKSGLDGTFEVFNYPVEPFRIGDAATRGLVMFSDPDHIPQTLDDIDNLGPEQRATLRVVLPSGLKVAGTVVDAAGVPVAGALVELVNATARERKATLTDATGKFTVSGLLGGPSRLNATALAIKQAADRPITLDGDQTDLDVRLQPMTLPANLKKVTVLGMELADVTPELQSAYKLYHPQGALILNPGQGHDRLEIGQLAEGYEFWQVGDDGRVGSVRDFVDQVLSKAAGQPGGNSSVRVVYTFRTAESTGTNTQYLKLTPADLKGLRAVADQLAAEAK